MVRGCHIFGQEGLQDVVPTSAMGPSFLGQCTKAVY